LHFGNLWADDDVTEQPGWNGGVGSPRPQLVHRKAQHVCRPWLIHPLEMQLFDGSFVDQSDAEVGITVNVERLQYERRQPLQVRFIETELKPCLIRKLDTHGFDSRILSALRFSSYSV